MGFQRVSWGGTLERFGAFKEVSGAFQVSDAFQGAPGDLRSEGLPRTFREILVAFPEDFGWVLGI